MNRTREEEMYAMGQKIRYLRRSKDYSQENLAEAMGVSSMTIYRIENGKAPIRMEYLIQLAEILDMTIEEIMTKEL